MQNGSDHRGLRTWIEVSRKALAHNIRTFRELIPKRTILMAVVKSNAYGHGLIDFSREMERLGADFLGVDSIIEALALRREGITTPILVLGYTLPELLSRAAEEHISVTVSTHEIVRSIVLQSKTFSRPLKVHIKVDTGMHRQGFLAKDLPKILGELKVKSLKSKVEPAGLYTHFASAKNPAFPKDTLDQLAEFQKWIDAFSEAGHRPLIHAAATAGTLLFPQSHFDMVRIGIGLYGLWPEKEVKEYLKGRIALRPALAWKSLVTEIKKLPKESRIGYDLTETLPKDGTIAVVPVGYWQGYPRALSSIGRVLIRGKTCKVLGRVSMDMISVSVGEVPRASVGDEVTVMSNREGSPVSAEGLSDISGVSWYEIVTRLNPLIKRIYR